MFAETPPIGTEVKLVYPEQRIIRLAPAGTGAPGLATVLPEAHLQVRYDVSVVLPVYDVSPYVRQCLDSILRQNGVALQLILVNDGSEDDSLSMVLEYLQRHEARNALVVDQTNRGLSAVRNIGTRLALGKYVAYLDTDDFMAPNAYAQMFEFAERKHLAAVFCRSLVFDSQALSFSPFYDAETWDTLLEGRSELVTNAARHPRLLMLEPNANTRLVRRDVIDRLALTYPQGLYFEDQPVHTKLLLAVSEVGLLDQTLYRYRINRPGKITATRSRRRFDVLRVYDLTMAVCETHQPTPEQGARILSALLRLTYWCGTETILDERREFFLGLSRRFAAAPAPWVARFNALFRQDLRQLVLLWALRRGDIQLLFDLSVGRRPAWPLLRFVFGEMRFGVIYVRLFDALRSLKQRLLLEVAPKT